GTCLSPGLPRRRPHPCERLALREVRIMRVLITGATGNVGTSLVESLLHDREVTEIIGVARREPAREDPRLRWIRADVGVDDLTSHLRGVDAVVHLAWQIQPSHDVATLARTNITGSRKVFH